jgi:hypothetical protein
LNKISQGPTLAKGQDAAGKDCGFNGIQTGDGCTKISANRSNGGTVTVTYSQPTTSC